MENIASLREKDILTVYLKDRLDTNTAPVIQQAIEAQLDGIMCLKIDMGELNYISSAGLRAILYLFQKMEDRNGEMQLCRVNSIIRDVFDITGLTDVFTFV